MIIWIVGTPRSGSTFLTEYIGQYCQAIYNEPFNTHPILEPNNWKFPQANRIVFKYCVNWINTDYILKKWPDSHFVHIWRNPNDVIYSMCVPKENSYPPRTLYQNGLKSLPQAVKRWFIQIIGCTSIQNKTSNYTEVKYEEIPQLTKLAGIELNKPLNFVNRNINPTLDWNSLPKFVQDFKEKVQINLSEAVKEYGFLPNLNLETYHKMKNNKDLLANKQ